MLSSIQLTFIWTKRTKSTWRFSNYVKMGHQQILSLGLGQGENFTGRLCLPLLQDMVKRLHFKKSSQLVKFNKFINNLLNFWNVKNNLFAPYRNVFNNTTRCSKPSLQHHRSQTSSDRRSPMTTLTMISTFQTACFY